MYLEFRLVNWNLRFGIGASNGAVVGAHELNSGRLFQT